MKYQGLFSLKKYKIKILSAAVVISTICVNSKTQGSHLKLAGSYENVFPDLAFFFFFLLYLLLKHRIIHVFVDVLLFSSRYYF